jgi:hypothetical protein
MRLFLEFKTIEPSSSSVMVSSVRATLVDTIAAEWDWFPAVGVDRERLINEMVAQLPREDAERFLGTVSYGFRSRTLASGLTVSFVETILPSEARLLVARVRVFVTRQQEAQLAEIGLDLANRLLRALPGMTLSAMIIWKDRGRDSVLEGGVSERQSVSSVLRNNPAGTTLAALSALVLVALLIGALIESAGWISTGILGSDAEDWFKRLVGPIASTLAASVVALGFEYRRKRIPFAFWRIGVETGPGP